MDERVIDLPKWLRTLIVKGIILNTRPKKSGKPIKRYGGMKVHHLLFYLKISTKNKATPGYSCSTRHEIRFYEYRKRISRIERPGVDEVLVVPLYPHYAMSSYETVVEKAKEVNAQHFPTIKSDFLAPFYNNEDYIKVMSEHIKKEMNGQSLITFYFLHGIPERHIRKSDPTKSHCQMDGKCCNQSSEAHKFCYRHQCFETTKGIANYLKLEPNTFSDSFQSRLGSDPWLKPTPISNSNVYLKEENKTKLAVVTPAFVSDCLETLEEIAMEGKEQFEEAGGKTYQHISCLNDNEDWASLMSKWIDN